MKIIAKTDEGFMIEATDSEVREIILSVSGAAPDKIAIGQKLPAIDYAGSIKKLKSLKDCYEFKHMINRVESFSKEFEMLKVSVNNAANIEA